MRMLRGSLLAAIMLIAASVAQAQELKVGNTYRGAVQITKDSGGIILPLPKGEWQLVALEPSRHTRDGLNLATWNGAFVSLDLSKQQRIKSFLTFYFAASDMFNGGWKVPDYCSANDLLYVQKTEAHRRRDIRCWGIKSYGMGLSPNSAQWWRDTQGWIKENTKHIPSSVIGITYVRASGPKLLNVQYYFNPAAVGQAQSGWTSALVEADPKKKKYIEGLKNFGTRWEPRVEIGFNGKQP